MHGQFYSIIGQFNFMPSAMLHTTPNRIWRMSIVMLTKTINWKKKMATEYTFLWVGSCKIIRYTSYASYRIVVYTSHIRVMPGTIY